MAFRAGRNPGESPGPLVGHPSELGFAGPHVLLADISEFQPNIDDKVYVDTFSQALIFRAMYGTRVDDAWFNGARREAAHNAGAQFVGMYQYVRAGQDAALQARAFAKLIGTMRPGEAIYADIEEGTGNQQDRWVTWANTFHGLTGWAPADYSGLAFAASHGLQPVDWVAAYGQPEPTVRHNLWQFTDSMRIPGIPTPVDCSVFHGSIGQLAMLAYPPKSAGWTFPAPADLRVTGQQPGGVRLEWEAVHGPSGQNPSSYTVQTLSSGAQVNQQVTRDLFALEFGPGGKGLPAGQYESRVWANGAPIGPPHASVRYELKGSS